LVPIKVLVIRAWYWAQTYTLDNYHSLAVAGSLRFLWDMTDENGDIPVIKAEDFGWKEISTIVIAEVVGYFYITIPLLIKCLLLIAALVILKSSKKFTSKLDCEMQSISHFDNLLEDYKSLKDMSLSLNGIIGNIIIPYGIETLAEVPMYLFAILMGKGFQNKVTTMAVIVPLIYFMRSCTQIGEEVLFIYLMQCIS
jgi:hypothetical protein